MCDTTCDENSFNNNNDKNNSADAAATCVINHPSLKTKTPSSGSKGAASVSEFLVRHGATAVLVAFVAIVALLDAGDGSASRLGPVVFAEATTCNQRRCAPGYFFSDCTAGCQQCDPGYYCKGNLTSPAACPSGTYQPEPRAPSLSWCRDCPSSALSGQAATFCIQCPKLYYAPDKTTCTQCPTGMVVEDGACALCDFGFFASRESGKCEPCSPGFACPTRTHDFEEPCPAGTYSNLADGFCRPCEAGFACPATTPYCTSSRSSNRVACQPGYYSTDNQTTCIKCPPAHYCPSTKSGMQIPCPRGSYSLGGQYKCTLCPEGFACDPAVNDGEPQSCTSGELSDGIKCNPCPAGYSCPTPVRKIPCDPGFTSAAGEIRCKACPAGSFCVGPTAPAELCPPGKIAANPGMTTCTPCPDSQRAQYQPNWGAVRCEECPPGHACPTVTEMNQCPLGTAARRGSFSCSPCAQQRPNVATYTPANASTTCTACPAGFACADPIMPPEACSAGFYSGTGQFFCTKCPAGRYCPNPSGDPVNCATGTYSLGGATSCTRCPANARCPFVDQGPIPCDLVNGYFAVPGATVCSLCPSGVNCGLSASGNLTFTLCEKGQYRDGVNCINCPTGFYCPTAAGTKIACPAGTYAPAGSITCYACPAGYQCPSRSAPIRCPAGFYSSDFDGFCRPCPRGSYCINTWTEPRPCTLGTFSLGQAQNCTVCPAGYECPNTDNFEALRCMPGTYSVGGQTKCTLCPPGYECPRTDEEFMRPCPGGYFSTHSQVNCTACPAGYACPSANWDQERPQPCKVGSYSVGRATSCTKCTAGNACPFASAAIETPCHAGTFTGPGEAACLLCAAGHYCPYTAVAGDQPFFGEAPFGRQIPCQPGTFAAPGSTSCAACPAGYACKSIYAADGERTLCPPGYQTIDDSNAYVVTGATNCAPCPIGRDCSVPGVAPEECGPGKTATVTGCVNCPDGYACPSPLEDPTPCPVGTFANNGSTECTPCDGGYVCQTRSPTGTPTDSGCPVGHYCPPGTSTAVMCPAGTFGRKVRATTMDEGCVTCLAGYYCPPGSAGLGALVPCPEGYYCTTGSAVPTPCPDGTFSTDRFAVSRATCLVCPSGFFCPAGCSQYAPNQCPSGFFCPAGTAHALDNPCPAGTYAQDGNLHSASNCLHCPTGFYCPTPGLSSPISCPAGTYQNEHGALMCKDCESGWSCPYTNMTTYVGFPCARGHYCAKGTPLPTNNPCPGGSYSYNEHNTAWTDCEVCWRGYACPRATGYSPTEPQPCAAGHYCPGMPKPANGQTHTLKELQFPVSGADNTFPCPAGSFSTATDLYRADQCQPCPAGEWCAGGLTTTSGPCNAGYYCPENSTSATQVPCPAGTYRTTTGGVRVEDCARCEPGYYCPEASSALSNCAAGTYNPDYSIELPGPPRDENERTCRTCPAGYFCGAVSLTPTVCPTGHFSEEGASVCTPCEVGRFCPFDAVSRDAMDRLYVCPATLYCPVGMSRIPQTQTDACPVGHYCPAGISTPTPCPVGTYNPVRGRGDVKECLACTPGFYCGDSGLSNVTGECDPGHYCPSGASSATQITCPPRYYRSTTRGENEDFCSVCPRGFYCTAGTSMPVPCTEGYYCITGTEIPAPCPIGTFANVTGLRSQDECIACSPGEYCDGLGLVNPTGLCDAGYFCLSRATTSAPPGLPTGGLCPKGGFCPPGSSFPTSCAQGTFNNFTGGSTQADCTACTPGYYCSGSNLPFPSGPCSAGFYCQGGAFLPTQFTTPEGHFSLAGFAAPEECPLGTFNPEFGKESCLPCLPGYFCPTRALVQGGFICPVGGYCPGGSTLPTPCPVGTYQPFARRMNTSDCLTCPEGSYCADRNSTQPSGECIEGFYCKRACVTPTCSQIITADGLKAHDPTDFTVTDSFGGQCPYGHYCPVGTADPIPCPIGTIRDGVRGISVDECTPCPAGYYCPEDGMSTLLSGDKVPQVCQAGYYCPGTIPGTQLGCQSRQCAEFKEEPCSLESIGCHGTTNVDLTLSSASTRSCPTGFYCPEGSVSPIRCGYFSDGRSQYAPNREQTSCDICPPGHYCEASDVKSLQVPITCPIGHYCPAGSRATMPKCPPGSYSLETGLHNMTQCTRCRPGHFCPHQGTEGLFEYHQPYCFGGYYCTTGAATGEGQPGVLGGVGGVCPVGHYCPNGTKTNTSFPCRPGTFKPTLGGSTALSCVLCPAGKYCQGSGNEYWTGDCEPGYYCPRGCKDRYCSNRDCPSAMVPYTGWVGGACVIGHYCVEGSAIPRACEPGTYSDKTHANTCTDCPPGFYCGQAASNPEQCPYGHYCPPKTRADAIPECPPGTYQPHLRRSNITDCLPCPAGHFCASHAMNYTTGPCAPGFFCESGAMTMEGVPGPRGGNGGECPQGHYCVTGTRSSTEFPCPAGTFQDRFRATNGSQCVRCTPGFYCETAGLPAVTGPCAIGYYCPTACQDAQCSNQPCQDNCAHPMPYAAERYAVGGPCPTGHYCPHTMVDGVITGSTAPIMCPGGTYAPHASSGRCLVCPPGRWCSVRTMQPQPCPPGFYCPNSTETPRSFPCPLGTFSPLENRTVYSDCQRCSPGYYCGDKGLSAPSGLCAKGYFCESGVSTARGIVGERGGNGGDCPVGHYCPEGTTSATKFACPPGTYQPLMNMVNSSACIPCTPGFYCPNDGMSSAGPACDLGYFCPRGCTDGQCTKIVEPVSCGRNCADPDNSPYVEGGRCPAGFYCPGVGGSRGTILPVGCPAGTYSLSGVSECTLCPPGFYCPPRTVTPISCVPGQYCPIGSRFRGNNCPIGTYNPLTRGNNLTDCLLCPPGKFCSMLAATEPIGDCFAGHWCGAGAVNGRGNTGPLGGRGGACPPGHYCPEGTTDPREFACEPGTFNPKWYAAAPHSCLNCTSGYYCQGSGNANVTGPCASGFTCLGPCTNAQCIACPFGFFCPQITREAPVITQLLGPTLISGSRLPQSCPEKTYTSGSSSACLDCPPGYYCPPGSISTLPRLCEPGRYCPGGTGLVQPRCPPGTYSTRVGLNSSTQCAKCPGGMFCASSGLIAPTGTCTAGYYCTGGAVDVWGRVGVLGGFPDAFPRTPEGYQLCPIGHYCPAGAAFPLQCPVGTYNPQQGRHNATQCRACDAGNYCDITGLTQPAGLCAAGYVCPRGCYDDQCSVGDCLGTSDVARGDCPVGFYCPTGSAVPTACPEGTYSGTPGASVCSECPTGFYCPLNTATPLPCPKGRFCPPGTRSSDIPKCPPGTFNNRTGLTNESSCELCLPSRACTMYGSSEPTEWCTEGYYCMRGAATAKGGLGRLGGSGGICPVGYYCPPATSRVIPCPVTTYNPDEGSSRLANCRTCSPGFFCPVAGAELPYSRCDAGFYCLQGESTPRPPLTHCPVGHYCPRGAVEPWVCPAGTYQPKLNATSRADCLPCPAGEYCLPGSGIPTGKCSAGYLCYGSNEHPTPRDAFCQPGYYCPEGSFDMIPCPPSFFCSRPRLGRPDGQCAPGYYCTLRATTPRPTNSSTGGICPVGHYCPSNSSFPVACKPGTYQPNLFAWSAASCHPCKAGFYCPRPAQSAVTDLCSEGYYCPAGQTSGTPENFKCPPGYKCREGTASPSACLPGTYQDYVGQSNCKECPPGSYCFTSSFCPGVNSTFPRACKPGFYCPAGTAAPNSFPCLPGSYSSTPSLQSDSDCTLCDPGRYCPKPGTGSVADLLCSAGFYCIAGARNPTPTDGTTGDRCITGHYCPEGTSAPLPCPAGRYSPNRGLKSVDECSICPPGYYCASEGLTSPTGLCWKGFYCPAGSTVGDSRECAFGRYCPPGSTSPKVCASGEYATGFKQDQCLPCPAGSYCDETQPCKYCNTSIASKDCLNYFTCPRTCPDGHYCPEGTRWGTQLPCPAGFFGPRPGLRGLQECGACPTGSYCPFEGLSSLNAFRCAPGYWCKNGSSVAMPRDGRFGEECPAGFYCTAGTLQPAPCPLGTYQPAKRASNITACVPCTAGMACTKNALSAPNVNCTAGYYCPGGLSTPTPYAYHCPKGLHCPTASAAPRPCRSGTISLQRGLAKCEPCPAGSYCFYDDQCKLFNSTEPRDCPTGYYCPEGTRFPTEYPCPLGSYGATPGLSHVDNCTTCEPGGSCERIGMVQTDIPNCAPSYFCTAGASRPDPTDASTGDLCPQGHYCPSGTGDPIACPAGTFNNGTGLYAEDQCTPCTPGSYCDTTGLTLPAGKCFGGYYCPPGQTSSTPSQYICPAGMRCPHGSSEPIHCADGTQAIGVTAREQCGPCTRGYFCNIVEQQLSPYFLHGDYVLEVPCPRGYACPQGTESRYDTPCVPGTYRNATGLVHPTECLQCPPGKFCLNPAAIEPTGLCEAGYYCVSGSWTPEPDVPEVPPEKAGKCPSGHYCKLGTVDPIPCPTGSYYDGTGAVNATWCRPCKPGHYCGTTGNINSAGDGLCNPGHYCPGGNRYPDDPNFLCPEGHFCGVGSEAPSPCPAGTYNGDTGRSTCTICPALRYCPIGSVIPIECAIGTVCPPGSAYELTCAKGLYVPPNAGRMADMSECRECDPGKFCSNGTISGECSAGYLCTRGNFRGDPSSDTDGTLPSGGGSKVGGLCPLGYYCPPGTTSAIPCKNNTVGLTPGLHRASDCSACQPGFYCVPGRIYPIPCPKGHYCPGFIGQAGGLIPCPAGTFNEKMQAPDPSWCLPCREGYYCPVEAMESTFRFSSPPGYYSTSGQQQPLPCPAGTYNDKLNGTARNVSACEACPVGYFCGPQSATAFTAEQTCPNGFVCPVGTYQPFHCPGGHYCPPAVEDPVPCPPGFYCDPDVNSTAPFECWRGTYCPNRTEIPLLCPFGYRGIDGVAVRDSVNSSCEACPPGTFSNDTLTCELCGAGHVCTGATTTEWPTVNQTHRGFVCPIGHYCPAGSNQSTPCPPGTFRNTTRGLSLDNCLPCAADYFNPLYGQSTCRRCGPSAVAPAGAGTCTCVGQNRVLQWEDQSCRCAPGFVFYPTNDRLSIDDGDEDCVDITYEVCRPGFIRANNGLCVEENDEKLCSHCATRGGGKVDPTTGQCLCNSPVLVENVCDANCRANAPRIFVDAQTNELVRQNPTTGAETRTPLTESGVQGSACDSASRLRCTVRLLTLSENGPQGQYEVSEAAFAAATSNTSANSTSSSTRRQLQQATTATLDDPVICLNLGETMMWDVSDPSRTHFPVYSKDSLMNTNPNFDYTQFRRLAELMRDVNLTINSFTFSFSSPGVHVFYDNALPDRYTVIRVATADEQCPDTPFMEATQASYLSVGATSKQSVNESPNWVMIGVLLAGLLLLFAGLLFGLWQVRRATWGMMGNTLPRYRTLGMLHLTGKSAGVTSRGFVRADKQDASAEADDAVQSRLITLRLDVAVASFIPADFIASLCKLLSCRPENILMVGVSDGSTIVRFMFHQCENPQAFADDLVARITDNTNPIHLELPILAHDAGRDDDLSYTTHPAYAMANAKDEYWDYERQLDVADFNVRTLYDKLEDQTIEIVRELAVQSDDVALLCDKILVESELLKDMFVRVKCQIDRGNLAEVEVIERRAAKMRGGTVEFELNDDVKVTLREFLRKYFDDSLERTKKEIDDRKRKDEEDADAERREKLDAVEKQLAELDTSTKQDETQETTTAKNARGVQFAVVADDAEDGGGYHDEMGKTLTGGLGGTLTRRRIYAPKSEFPREMRDDSDIEDSERVDRAKQREELLALRLRRARRMADSIAMPFGLDDVPASTGIRSMEESLRASKQRTQWKADRRSERKALDNVTMRQIEQRPAALTSTDDKLLDSKRRNDRMYRRLRRLRDAITALELPQSLADQDSLAPTDRLARGEKRARFIDNKIMKLRKARAEASVPYELDTDSDTEPRDAVKRQDAAEEHVQKVLEAQPHEPSLPSAEVSGLSIEQRQARRSAVDHAINVRMATAASMLETLALPADASDHSDLEDAERQARRAARASAARSTLAAAGSIVGRVVAAKGRSGKAKGGALASTDSNVTLKRVDFNGLLRQQHNGPDEYRDDSDLDDDERDDRKELRAAFKKGRDAPIDAQLPENPREAGIDADEAAFRERLNNAFTQGREARHGANPAELQRRADDVKRVAASRDQATAQYVELGQKQADAGAMPDDYRAPGKHALAAAFTDGKRAVAVSAPLAPLSTENERIFADARNSATDVDNTHGMALEQLAHNMGRAVERSRAMDEAFDAEVHFGNARAAAFMKEAHERGRAAGASLAIPESVRSGDAKRAFLLAASGCDVDAASAGRPLEVQQAARKGAEVRARALELMDHLYRDDVPLLSEDEIVVRRAARAAFLVGMNAKQAEMAMFDVERDTELPDSDRTGMMSAFALARKTQRAADAMPAEYEGDEAKAAAHLRGVSAGHMMDVFQIVAPSHSDGAVLRSAMVKGKSAQRALSEVPEELVDMPGLAPADAKKRSAGRAALVAGRNAATAAHIVEELEDRAAPKEESQPPSIRRSASMAVVKAETAAAAVRDDQSAQDALKAVKKEYQSAFKSLKAKHAIEKSQALEDLEDELIAEAKSLDADLDEHFVREKKRLGDKHHLELLNADASKAEGLKARQAAQLQHLERGQEEVRKQAQELLVKRGHERRAKLEQVMQAKAMNELRLQKTISADQEKEIQRLQKQAQADTERGDVAREEELKVQKQRLIEKIHARDKRLKVKISKEREFLQHETRELAALRVESVEANLRDRQNLLAGRMEELAQRGLIEPSELVEEQDHIAREMTSENERRVAGIKSDMETARIEREKALTERHAKRTQALIAASQHEIEELLEEQKKHESEGEKAVAPDAEAAAALLAKQEEQRRKLAAELEEARKAEAAKLGADEKQVKQEADRRIAQAERERGQRLSDQQKRAIMDDCSRDAARMREAMTDEQRAQQEAAKKKLEERRKKKEQELQRQQLAERERELKRQEEAAKKRQTDLKAKLKVTAVVVSDEVKREAAEAEKQKKAKLAELKRAQEEELAAVQADLEAAKERDIAKLKEENERRAAEMRARQAKEVASAQDSEKAAILERHAQEAEAAQNTLSADAAAQRDKVQAQIEARKQRKQRELERRHEQELRAARQREEDAVNAMVKAEQLKAEEKQVKEAISSGKVQAEKAADVAQVVMSERHMAEAKRLVERQTERRTAEKKRLAEAKAERLEQATANGADVAAVTKEIDEEQAAFLEQLELDFSEEMMRLKLAQWEEVSQASGMASPEEVLRKHRAKAAKASAVKADDDLLKFKQAKQAEQEALQARMAKEQQEYEAKLAKEMESRREALDKELQEKEAAIVQRLEAEKAKREKLMLDANTRSSTAAADSQAKIKERLIAESRQDEERMRDNLVKERERQQKEVEDRLKRRRERESKKREAMDKLRTGGDAGDAAASPTDAAPSSPKTAADAAKDEELRKKLEAQREQLLAEGRGDAAPASFETAASAGAPAGGPALDVWVRNVVAQVETSDLLPRVERIEEQVEQQCSDALLMYYVDERDREVGKCEGTLTPVDPSELSTAEFVVYFFGVALRENFSKVGVNVPNARIAVASSLPMPQCGMNAYRNSYHFDGRTLFIRRSRLASIGEFAIVVLHALAHLKISRDAALWDDSNPKFTGEFYGMLELMTEEMFFVRLPAVKATRDVHPNRGYRPESIMSTKSLGEIENSLRRVSKSEREAFLRTYLQI